MPTRTVTPPAAGSLSVGERAPEPQPAGSTKLRYVEVSPILVRGTATGRHYVFSGDKPVQAVDARDVDVLLRTRFFRRAF